MSALILDGKKLAALVEQDLSARVAALKARKVPVETHLCAEGGHGFGLRRAVGKPVEVWPDLWRAWARTTGLG